MDNALYKIPSSWKWVTLDDIGIVVSGGTPSTKDPEFWNGDIPWITPADLSEFEGVYIEEGARNISQTGLDYSSAYLLPSNSLVFSSRAPIGYVAITKNELATNQGFKNLILPSNLINVKYVYYYLGTIKELAENMASGTTFLELSAIKFKKIPIPIAPIEEQERIVEKIEELYSLLNKSKIELLKSKDASDKLIKKTIYNLFKALKKRKPLKELAIVSMGQSPESASFNTSGLGIPFFQGKKEFGKIYPLPEKYTTKAVKLANKNDILISVRAPVGDVNIANLDCAIGRGLGSIKFDGYNKFLFYYLDSIKSEIEQLGTGSTFSSISKGIIENIQIPYTETDNQIALIDELEIQLEIYQKMIDEIDHQIQNNEILKNKILKQAFQGDLSIQFDDDLSTISMLSHVELEKQNYLLLQKATSKKKKKEKVNHNLKNIIESNFKNMSFRYEDIVSLNILPLDKLSLDWGKLLDEGYIKKSYNSDTKQIQFIKP